MIRKLWTKHRRSMLVVIALLVWVIVSIPPLIGNRPADFQASGSIIVLLAVLLYARERVRRENEVFRAQRNQIVSMLDQHDTWGDFHASQAKRTAIENEIEILQLRLKLEKGKAAQSTIKPRLQALRESLLEGAERHKNFETKFEASHKASMIANEEAEKTVRLQEPTAKAMERLELALIAFGTLQWGYGDRWVNCLHSII